VQECVKQSNCCLGLGQAKERVLDMGPDLRWASGSFGDSVPLGYFGVLQYVRSVENSICVRKFDNIPSRVIY